MIKVEIPKWRIDDPFGRNALRSVCYDLKKALCESEGYRVEIEEMLKAKSAACEGISEHINNVIALAKTLDEMRKRLAANNKELREENAKLWERLLKAEEERDQFKRDYAELEVEHEKLVRGLTDKEVEV